MLRNMLDKTKAAVKELHVLSGYLNFLSRAIFPGHTFIRRMYGKYNKIINLQGTQSNSYEFKLKQYHHMCLDKEFKDDCRVWLAFISGNLRDIVNRPMVDLFGTVLISVDIAFYSDASAKKTFGFGCILRNK